MLNDIFKKYIYMTHPIETEYMFFKRWIMVEQMLSFSFSVLKFVIVLVYLYVYCILIRRKHYTTPLSGWWQWWQSWKPWALEDGRRPLMQKLSLRQSWWETWLPPWNSAVTWAFLYRALSKKRHWGFALPLPAVVKYILSSIKWIVGF